MILSLRRIMFIPLLCAAMYAASCGPSAEDMSQVPEPRIGAGEARFQEFAERVATSLDAGDPGIINDAFDCDAVFDRIAAGINATDKDRQGFLDEIPPGFGFGDAVARAMGEKGSFRMLAFHWDDGHPRALYRSANALGLLNYYEFYFGERADTQITIRDVYIYMTGERLTETIVRVVSASQNSSISTLLRRMAGQQGTTKAIDSMAELVRAGNYQETLDYYNQLPPEPRKEKMVQLFRMRAAQNTDMAEYEKVLEDMSHMFAGDPGLDLVMMDHYIMKKRYDSAQATIDRLDSSLGGDPYLDYVRANIDMARSDYSSAREKLQRLVAYDSMLAAPYIGLLTISLEQQDHPGTVRMLDILEEKLDIPVSPEIIATDTTYAVFTQSDEYREWAARRR